VTEEEGCSGREADFFGYLRARRLQHLGKFDAGRANAGAAAAHQACRHDRGDLIRGGYLVFAKRIRQENPSAGDKCLVLYDVKDGADGAALEIGRASCRERV